MTQHDDWRAHVEKDVQQSTWLSRHKYLLIAMLLLVSLGALLFWTGGHAPLLKPLVTPATPTPLVVETFNAAMFTEAISHVWLQLLAALTIAIVGFTCIMARLRTAVWLLVVCLSFGAGLWTAGQALHCVLGDHTYHRIEQEPEESWRN